MENENKLTGKIRLIGDTQTFESGFKKREFVIDTEGEYSQPIKFEVVKDKTDYLDKYQVGQSVEVSYNLKGAEWNGKYFVNLVAWKVFAAEGSQTQPGANSQAASQQPVTSGSIAGDDIPF